MNKFNKMNIFLGFFYEIVSGYSLFLFVYENSFSVYKKNVKKNEM